MNTSPVSRSNSQIPRGVSRLEGIPWLALASLLAVLICIGASISVIVTSDTQIVESWAIQPAVLLAILASVSSIAVSTAFSAAVVVTWWTSAMEGASLAQLHYIWDRGEGISFFSAIAAGANARRVVLTASIIVAVKLATNPLMQRATHQTIDDIATRGTIKLNLAQSIPEGWWGDRSPEISLSLRAVGILRDWSMNATLNSLDAPGYHCDGTCKGSVPGAGIHYNCSSTTQTLDLLASKDTAMFEVNTTMSQNFSTGVAPFFLLTTLYPSAIDDACIATLTIDTCKIEAGIVEYPVTLQNLTVTLRVDSDKLNNVTALSTYNYAGDFSPFQAGGAITSLAILDVLFNYYVDFINGTQLNGSPFEIGISERFYQSDSSNYNNNSLQQCPFQWSSPTSYILNSMQDIMFRAAWGSANNTDAQTFTVLSTKPALVFHTRYGYLVAASTITLLGVLSTLIMLQGWWVLRRTTTLSPLETNKAFSAPLLERTDNLTVDGILGDVGKIWVKYVDGVMTVYDDGHVVQPEEGQMHGVEEAQGDERVSIFAI